MRHIFIVNPVAGKADASKTIVPQILDAIHQQGLSEEEYAIEITQHAGHAGEIAASFAKTGERVCLYACGGDGTFHEVLNGAFGYENASIACVPCGSGNDFVRNFGPAEEFLNIGQLLQGTEVAIDLMEIDGEKSASICSAGLDAQIADGIDKFRRLPFCGGSMAYTLSIITELLKPLGRPLSIRLDGTEIRQDCLLVAICNGGWYGGGYNAGPESLMDDGTLEAQWVKKIGRLRIASVLGMYKKGEHIKDGAVAPALADVMGFGRAGEVTVTSLDGAPIVITQDGECRKVTSFTARVLPKAVRVRVPAALAASKHLKPQAPAGV